MTSSSILIYVRTGLIGSYVYTVVGYLGYGQQKNQIRRGGARLATMSAAERIRALDVRIDLSREALAEMKVRPPALPLAVCAAPD